MRSPEVDIAAAGVTVAKRKEPKRLQALLQAPQLRVRRAAVVVRLQAQGGSMLPSSSPVAVLLPKRLYRACRSQQAL